MKKEIFIEKLLRIINQEKNKVDGIELAFVDIGKFILNVFIVLLKESNNKNV